MGWADVPLTRLAGTAQERIAPDPEPVVLDIARYGETDLLCYRAEARRRWCGASRRSGSPGWTGRRGDTARGCASPPA